MTIDLRDVQDVYKDAGSDIIFATFDLKRQDPASDKAMIADLAEHLPAFINFRVVAQGMGLSFSRSRTTKGIRKFSIHRWAEIHSRCNTG